MKSLTIVYRSCVRRNDPNSIPLVKGRGKRHCSSCQCQRCCKSSGGTASHGLQKVSKRLPPERTTPLDVFGREECSMNTGFHKSPHRRPCAEYCALVTERRRERGTMARCPKTTKRGRSEMRGSQHEVSTTTLFFCLAFFRQPLLYTTKSLFKHTKSASSFKPSPTHPVNQARVKRKGKGHWWGDERAVV